MIFLVRVYISIPLHFLICGYDIYSNNALYLAVKFYREIVTNKFLFIIDFDLITSFIFNF